MAAFSQASELHSAIDAAARYLTTGCNTNGQFIYRVNMDAAQPVKAKYNLLRHAGAMIALAQVSYSGAQVVANQRLDFLWHYKVIIVSARFCAGDRHVSSRSPARRRPALVPHPVGWVYGWILRAHLRATAGWLQ